MCDSSCVLYVATYSQFSKHHFIHWEKLCTRKQKPTFRHIMYRVTFNGLNSTSAFIVTWWVKWTNVLTYTHILTIDYCESSPDYIVYKQWQFSSPLKRHLRRLWIDTGNDVVGLIVFNQPLNIQYGGFHTKQKKLYIILNWRKGALWKHVESASTYECHISDGMFLSSFNCLWYALQQIQCQTTKFRSCQRFKENYTRYIPM